MCVENERKKKDIIEEPVYDLEAKASVPGDWWCLSGIFFSLM